MGNIRKEILGLSDWLTYELEPNKILDPPVIRVRLKPINRVQSADFMGLNDKGKVLLGSFVFDAALDAVQAWDVNGLDGQLLILNNTNKSAYLGALFGRLVVAINDQKVVTLNDEGKEVEKKLLFGNAVFEYASNIENFLKN